MPESKRTPYYLHVAESIVEHINTGEFPPGGRIPSIRELSETFQVAKSTVERALYRLVDRGILNAEQGRGMFVATTMPKRADGQTRVIGFLAPMHARTYMGRGFYADVLNGIQETLAGADRSLLIINERGLGRADPKVDLREELVDAYIVIGPVGNQFMSLVKRVGRPMVFVDHDASGLGYDSVVADNIKGSFEITKHLLDFGHREIAFLGGLLKSEPDPQDKHYIDTTARERFSGFRIAMEMSGIKVEDKHILKVEDRVEEHAYETLEEAWKKGIRPTGIVGFGASDAEAAVKFFKKVGRTVPGDASVVAFAGGNKVDGKILTGVDFDAHKMGNIAGQLVVQRVERGYDAFRSEIVPVKFIEGQTTAVAPKK